MNDRSQRHFQLGLLGSLWNPSAEPQARIPRNQNRCGGQGSQEEIAGGSLCLRHPWAEALAGATLTQAMVGHGTSDPGGAAGNGPKDCPGTGPEGCRPAEHTGEGRGSWFLCDHQSSGQYLSQPCHNLSPQPLKVQLYLELVFWVFFWLGVMFCFFFFLYF